MSRQFTLNGRDVRVRENDFDYVKDVLKKNTENIQIDDFEKLEAQNNCDENFFLLKSQECFELNAYVKSHEKLWSAASFSLKAFFLTIGVELASHSSKNYAITAITTKSRKLRLMFDDFDSLHWKIDKDVFRCHNSINELVSTSPEDWKQKHRDVEDFVKSLNNLRSDYNFQNILLSV